VSDDFISRWSRRKIEARKGERPNDEIERSATPVQTGAQPSPADAPQAPELPPLESLTPESDFSPFMKSEVDPKIRRDALKTLFQDPRHNVMDGLDVYIDDYSQPDPLPDGWLEKLNVMAHLGDQPAMRKEAEEKAAKAVELEMKRQAEQGLVASSEPHPDGASELPSPPPESKDYPPGGPG
jgi:hypothetical protein